IGSAFIGQATNGTRFILNFTQIPQGATIIAPAYAYLYRAGTGTPVMGTPIPTGVARRINPGLPRGDNPTTGAGPVADNALAVVASAGTASVLYEVIFSRHDVREEIVIRL